MFYRRVHEDRVLSLLPAFVLPFFVKDSTDAVLIASVVLTSVLYWNHKTCVTFVLDIIAATLLVMKASYDAGVRAKRPFATGLVFLVMAGFFLWSYRLGRLDKSQLLPHMAFRSCILLLLSMRGAK